MTYRFLAALAAATLPLVPATAQTAPATQTVAVRDLDLSRHRDRTTLDRRLAHAAREVCGEASSFDLVGRRNQRDCRETVVRDALPQRNRLVALASGISVAGQ